MRQRSLKLTSCDISSPCGCHQNSQAHVGRIRLGVLSDAKTAASWMPVSGSHFRARSRCDSPVRRRPFRPPLDARLRGDGSGAPPSFAGHRSFTEKPKARLAHWCWQTAMASRSRTAQRAGRCAGRSRGGSSSTDPGPVELRSSAQDMVGTTAVEVGARPRSRAFVSWEGRSSRGVPSYWGVCSGQKDASFVGIGGRVRAVRARDARRPDTSRAFRGISRSCPSALVRRPAVRASAPGAPFSFHGALDRTPLRRPIRSPQTLVP